MSFKQVNLFLFSELVFNVFYTVSSSNVETSITSLTFASLSAASLKTALDVEVSTGVKLADGLIFSEVTSLSATMSLMLRQRVAADHFYSFKEDLLAVWRTEGMDMHVDNLLVCWATGVEVLRLVFLTLNCLN